jgi:hypothetical protein
MEAIEIDNRAIQSLAQAVLEDMSNEIKSELKTGGTKNDGNQDGCIHQYRQ